MKSCRLILFSLIFFSASAFYGQDHCLYNSLKGYDFGPGYQDIPKVMLEQEDGRFILVVESYYNISNSFQISLMRLFPNANPDPTFRGGDGKITTTFSQRNTVTCAALQDDGKILVAGYQAPGNGVSSFRSYVARFNSDGTADAGFGMNGSIQLELSGMTTSSVNGIEVLPDGKIRGISSRTNVGVNSFRLMQDGSLDLTYGTNGTNLISLSPWSIGLDQHSAVFLPDSTAFIAGTVASAPFGFKIIKIDANGDPVIGFGTNGVISHPGLDFGNTEVEIIQAFDGNLLISAGTGPMIIKIDSETGALISSFGNAGEVTTPIEVQSMKNYQWVKDEPNQEYILLLGNGSANCGTLRMDDMGNLLTECNGIFTPVNYPAVGGSKTYYCGLIDSQGLFRIGVHSGAVDINAGSVQNFNASWAYYTPPYPDPQIASVSPSVIPLLDPSVISVEGYGLSSATLVELISASDTVSSSEITVINDEEIQVLIFPDSSDETGLYDVRIYLSSTDTLTLAESISLSDESYKNGDIQVLSRRRIQVNAQTNYLAHYRNEGSSTQIAFPIIFINENPLSTNLELVSQYDYEIDPIMQELMTYLIDQGIDTQILQETTFQDGDNMNNAFLTSDLARGESAVIQGKITTPELLSSEHTVYMNPNALVSAQGLTESYIPSPSFCMAEMVSNAMMTAFPDLDLSTEWEACFLSSYTGMQAHLADIARSQNYSQLIPFKGTMMGLCYHIATCVDPDYILSEEGFKAFSAQMALLLANNIILDEAFDCEEYVEASAYFRNAEKPEGHLDLETRDAWGIGINFKMCTGCVTYAQIDGASSVDPNEKIGPFHQIGQGYTNNPGFFYAIHFENLDSAQLSAKRVLITDTLDTDLFDLSTLRFTLASWGERSVELNQASTLIDLRPELPNILQIDRSLDMETGVVSWEFLTLDTLSMNLTEVLEQGFLPPNVNSPEGMGFVGFEVDLKDDVPSGSLVLNDASITFDYNAVIQTNTYENIYDFLAPESHVNEIIDYVPGENTVTISWESESPDPSLLFYNIYYNTDGGTDWELWQLNTTMTSAVFTGELGTTYYFQSIAIDSALNVESFSETFDAFVLLDALTIGEQDAIVRSVYPNPTNDWFILSLSRPQIISIELFDIAGRSVLEIEKATAHVQYRVSTAGLAAGSYLLVIGTEEERFTGRLIKE